MHRKSTAPMRSRLADTERVIFRDRRLLFVDAADVRPAGPAVEQAGERGELGCGADGVDFDAPIVEIARVAGEAELGGGVLGEVAVADALHATANIPAACLVGFRLRLAHSGQGIV